MSSVRLTTYEDAGKRQIGIIKYHVIIHIVFIIVVIAATISNTSSVKRVMKYSLLTDGRIKNCEVIELGYRFSL